MHGFGKSCSVETGRLLHVLAGQRGRTRVAEIGTGCGVGAAWILSALDPGTPFVTVELDAERAAAAAELLAGDEHARCSTATGGRCSPEAPFDLLFADGGKAKAHEEILGLLAPGGTLVLDDLTPGHAGPDPVRELWLGHPRLAGGRAAGLPAGGRARRHTSAAVACCR